MYMIIPFTDILYQAMLQEYHSMLSQIPPPIPIADIKNCQNSCNESTDRTSGDECHCDQHCVAFRDCCLDYWQRFGQNSCLFCFPVQRSGFLVSLLHIS